MKSCQSCQHYDPEGSWCAFNPARIFIKEPETYWCGRFKPQATTFASDMAGPAEKVSDKEILEWFETMPEHRERHVIAPVLAAKFSVTERTIKERLKRLKMLGILKCTSGSQPRPGDKPFWQFSNILPDEAQSRAWWGDILAAQKPRGWALLAGKGRTREWSDIEPAFKALSATEAAPRTFSDLYRAQSQLSPMGRSTFSRLLSEAVSERRIVKSPEGLYGIKSDFEPNRHA